jgi:hypothetical protein
VNNLAADRRPGSFLKINIGELLAVVVAHYKVGVLLFDRPRWREAAGILTSPGFPEYLASGRIKSFPHRLRIRY